METKKFKTNAKCAVCVQNIGIYLNRMVEPSQWEIDMSSPGRVVTVISDLPDEDFIAAFEDAGLRAERVHTDTGTE